MSTLDHMEGRRSISVVVSQIIQQFASPAPDAVFSGAHLAAAGRGGCGGEGGEMPAAGKMNTDLQTLSYSYATRLELILTLVLVRDDNYCTYILNLSTDYLHHSTVTNVFMRTRAFVLQSTAWLP